MEDFSWEVVGKILRLYPLPTETRLGALKIKFKPSRYWKKKHPHLEPIITTNLIAGQQEYKLPAYFRAGTIDWVDILKTT